MRTRLLIFAGIVGLSVFLASCGSDTEKPAGTTSSTATDITPATSTTSTTTKGTTAKAKAPRQADFLPCLRKGGAFLAQPGGAIPRPARSKSTDPFAIGFKNATFGRQVGNVVFLPFTHRALTRRTLRAIKPTLDKRRRVFLRDQMLVIFGTRGNRKASTLVIDCLDKGLKKSQLGS